MKIILLLCFVAIQDISAIFNSKLLHSSKIHFFYGTSYLDNDTYPLDQASEVLNHPQFFNYKDTVLYIHGYDGKVTDEDSRAIISVYQYRADHNILILNWDEISAGSYVLDVILNVPKYAPILADAVLKMLSNGFNIKSLHVLAHSLGGQLAGYLGREIQNKSKLKLKRITGLDPAGALFYFNIISKHLSSSDAEMVDVIHTDASLYGSPLTLGHVDFWVNGGKAFQPGCPTKNNPFRSPNSFCSHARSWRYYVESVAFKNSKFISTACPSLNNYSKGTCDGNRKIQMGIYTPADAKGSYYLTTNAMAPFSRCEEGQLKFSKNQKLKTFNKKESKRNKWMSKKEAKNNKKSWKKNKNIQRKEMML